MRGGGAIFLENPKEGGVSRVGESGGGGGGEGPGGCL